MSRPTAQQIRTLAREQFGFQALRPGQLEGVQSVLSGRDTLCVMRTGVGKSAIYQLAGLLLVGPTIVRLTADRTPARSGGRYRCGESRDAELDAVGKLAGGDARRSGGR